PGRVAVVAAGERDKITPARDGVFLRLFLLLRLGARGERGQRQTYGDQRNGEQGTSFHGASQGWRRKVARHGDSCQRVCHLGPHPGDRKRKRAPRSADLAPDSCGYVPRATRARRGAARSTTTGCPRGWAGRRWSGRCTGRTAAPAGRT